MMLTLTDIARERPGSAHRCCNCRSDPNPDVYMGRGRARNLELAHQMRLGWAQDHSINDAVITFQWVAKAGLGLPAL
ncbi:hypothetical protein AAP_01969 [Ascosphaera apis ARSEF 7405]|uniref:Uncharacterized protein n=1 Tax=Ascosphaera apis ARSEF 7405 TaxID=392613 RepID=A0A168B1Q8_9EURO|nr:hypothetical protein AAP_01969 [Ascosphaera apis ARSEF 7405]